MLVEMIFGYKHTAIHLRRHPTNVHIHTDTHTHEITVKMNAKKTN